MSLYIDNNNDNSYKFCLLTSISEFSIHLRTSRTTSLSSDLLSESILKSWSLHNKFITRQTVLCLHIKLILFIPVKPNRPQVSYGTLEFHQLCFRLNVHCNWTASRNSTANLTQVWLKPLSFFPAPGRVLDLAPSDLLQHVKHRRVPSAHP